MRLLKTLPLLTALSIPLTNSGCNPNPTTNIKAVENLDVKNKELIKQEQQLAQDLNIWSSYVSDFLYHMYTITENPEDAINARERLIKLGRIQEDCARETRNIFDIENPNEEQVETFIRLLSHSNKSVDEFKSYFGLPIEVIETKIEKHLRGQTPKLSEEEIQSQKESKLEYFIAYKESHDSVVEQTATLIKNLEAYNKNANASRQPTHKPIWGLTLKQLKNLK
jgi:hypothetical protein